MKNSGAYEVNPGEAVFLTNRCRECGRLITKLEILKAFKDGSNQLCPCGSRTIRPANPRLWEEFLLPRCWRLLYALLVGKVSAPTQDEPKSVEPLR